MAMMMRLTDHRITSWFLAVSIMFIMMDTASRAAQSPEVEACVRKLLDRDITTGAHRCGEYWVGLASVRSRTANESSRAGAVARAGVLAEKAVVDRLWRSLLTPLQEDGRLQRDLSDRIIDELRSGEMTATVEGGWTVMEEVLGKDARGRQTVLVARAFPVAGIQVVDQGLEDRVQALLDGFSSGGLDVNRSLVAFEMVPREQLQSASLRIAGQIAPGWSSPLGALLAGRELPVGPSYEPHEHEVMPIVGKEQLSQAMRLLDERIDDSQLAYLISVQFDSLGYPRMSQLMAARHLDRFPGSAHQAELSGLLKAQWALEMSGLSR